MPENEALNIDHDLLITHIERWKKAEGERASTAADTRGEIGQYLKDSGLHNKALAICRQIDKMPEEKRDDLLRSLDALFETLRPKWDGQKTADMFDGGSVAEGDAGEEEVADPDAVEEPADNVQAIDFSGSTEASQA